MFNPCLAHASVLTRSSTVPLFFTDLAPWRCATAVVARVTGISDGPNGVDSFLRRSLSYLFCPAQDAGQDLAAAHATFSETRLRDMAVCAGVTFAGTSRTLCARASSHFVVATPLAGWATRQPYVVIGTQKVLQYQGGISVSQQVAMDAEDVRRRCLRATWALLG